MRAPRGPKMSSRLRRVLERKHARRKRMHVRVRNKRRVRARRRGGGDEKIRRFREWCGANGIALHPDVRLKVGGAPSTTCTICIYTPSALCWPYWLLCRHRCGSHSRYPRGYSLGTDTPQCAPDCCQQQSYGCHENQQSIPQTTEDNEQLGSSTASTANRVWRGGRQGLVCVVVIG